MLSGRPLLYLSLPGVAFILGVFWFRRRNKNRIDRDGDAKATIETDELIVSQKINSNVAPNNCYYTNGTIPNGCVAVNGVNGVHGGGAKSININNGTIEQMEKHDNATARLFSKSAPIQIQSNGRTSTNVIKHQNPLDSEVLKSKMQDVEHKHLCSIDEDFENLSSPVDLPDSVDNRISFHARNAVSKSVEPVVIRATCTPKISPENSFFENNYTKSNDSKEDDVVEQELPTEQEIITTPVPVDNVRMTEIKEEVVVLTSETDLKEELIDMDMDVEPETETETEVVAVEQKRSVDTASPSLSICSVQSGDSGKGSSLPRSEATRAKALYQFLFPTNLIGRIYGNKSSFMNHLKARTSVNIVFCKYIYSKKLHICQIEGSESEIQLALSIIRSRLPLKRYPNFTMQRLPHVQPDSIVELSADNVLNLQLNLIEGINNDVVVSVILSGSHIFVQHPLHPSHPSLAALQKCMYESYGNGEAPLLPTMAISAVCVLCVAAVWYRVQIVGQDPENSERCIVKFLDFGGYMNVHFKDLRQIRTEFMAVPFQATECMLSHIEPMGDQWSAEAVESLTQLTKGIVLQAQVSGYNRHALPTVYLFANLGPNKVVFINEELAARKHARWVEPDD